MHKEARLISRENLKRKLNVPKSEGEHHRYDSITTDTDKHMNIYIYIYTFYYYLFKFVFSSNTYCVRVYIETLFPKKTKRNIQVVSWLSEKKKTKKVL